MEKIIKKRFPATTELNSLTFLNDKKVDGDLYASFQSLSKYENEKTYVLKKDLPKQIDICEILGIKSPKNYRTHLLYLIEYYLRVNFYALMYFLYLNYYLYHLS